MREDRPALDPSNAYPELRRLVKGKPADDPVWRRFWVIWLLAWIPAFSIILLADIEVWSLMGLVILAVSLAAGFLVEAVLRRVTSMSSS